MTAPTINGTRYPQPVDALLPAARKLTRELGEVPSRNRLMTEFRIGAPKATELRQMLAEEWPLLAEQAQRAASPRPRAFPDPVGSPEHGPECHCVLCNHIREAKAGTGRQEPADEPPSDPWDYAEPIGPDPQPTPPVPESVPLVDPTPQPSPAVPAVEPVEQVTAAGHPGTPAVDKPGRRAVAWPVILLALPAFVAIWSGWVGLGGLTGFGVVHPLPGIADSVSLNTAITLPIGVETYGAYALYVWLSGRVPTRARTFAKWSAIASLAVGAAGQVAYHLLVAAGVTSAPWWITTLVSCLPVAVLGMGAALAHLVREDVTK